VWWSSEEIYNLGGFWSCPKGMSKGLEAVKSRGSTFCETRVLDHAGHRSLSHR
jgi:hypothetical protein